MSNLLSGFEFNKRFPSIVFVKLTNETENHNGFQFKTGLNIDTQEFDPTGECKKGGIYFCQYNKIPMWIQYNQIVCINYRIVTIPDDAWVYMEKDKFKANKMILSEEKDIRCDEEIRKILVAENIDPLYFVIDQTDELCMIAVAINGKALRYVKNQTKEICDVAIKECSSALCYVRDQTEELCKMVVAKDGNLLWCVKDQTNEICKIAVEQNWTAIRYVKKQTEEILKIALEQDYNAMKYIMKMIY
jgi:hypothetical protein